MQRAELENLSRKELQSLAKAHGIKANLSNKDIIAKLCEVEVPTASAAPVEVSRETSESENATPSEIEPIIVEDVKVVEETVPVVVESVIETVPEVACESSVEHNPAVGDEVEAIIDGCWVHASVKRLNKKTARVVAFGTKEFTLKFTELRPISNTAAVPAAIESVAVSANDEDVVQTIEEPITEPIIDVVLAEEEIVSEPVGITQQSEAMEVVEAPAEEIAVEEASMETVQEPEPVALVAPAPTPLAVIRVDYLEPLSCPRAPPTPKSCARTSVGWNSCTRFSLEDSAVKSAAAPSSRRKERRKARRSAMKQLAESMKQEGMESNDTADCEEETATNNEAQVAITSTPLVVPTPVCAIVPVVAPAPASASVSAASKEMLPRMNKAQLMRIGAIQKKIVTTEQVPPSSTAFTTAAKPASSSATPSHARQSISAPSSVAGGARPAGSASASSSVARPSLKVATPLSGVTHKNALSSRASIAGGSMQQTSGLKRKLDSSDRSSSVHSNAPDFKRMHSKQFTALKSITECVEQDKHVGVRMTIAMESAMTTNASTASTASTSKPPTTSTNAGHRLSTIAEVAKPAANPFNKVLGISKGSTPGKAAATPAPLVLSRPATGINTSANIVKSRTVTSFVSSACASGGAGGQKVTSFLNNENERPSGNSFLKSKDLGSGSAKHRSVSMSGSSFGQTQQKLQML